MKTRFKRIVIGSVVIQLLTPRLAFPAPQVPRGPVVTGEVGQRVHAYLSRFSEWGYAGAVLVAKDGEVVLAQGYGFADRDNQRPNTPTTVFTIGSITKQFTGAAILTLERTGKISVDDPITKHIDDVPEDKQGITIHHLLTHSAGLPGAIGTDFDTTLTRDTFLRKAMGTPLGFLPGERYEYSNVGYSILGIILEKTTGTGYEEYLRKNLFEPAGMKQTGYLQPEFRDEDLAIGYRDGKPWGVVIRKDMLPDGPSWHLRANGGIHSTVLDMYRWHLALQGEEILTEDSKKKLFAPHVAENPEATSHYGYGWAVFRTPHGKLIAHNGGNGIFSADFRHYVDKNVMYFVACSVAEYDIDDVSEKIARVVFSDSVSMPPETVVLERDQAEKLVGRYSIDEKATLSVAVANGNLVITPEGQDAYAAIFPGRAISEEAASRAAHAVKSMIENSISGDHALLQQSLGATMSAEQVKQMAEGRWRELQDEHGEFQRLEALGVSPATDGLTAVTLQYYLANGSTFARYVMQGNAFRGARALGGPPSVTFRQTKPGEFIAFDFDSGESRRISFTMGEAGATGVKIERDGREIDARRIQ